MKEQRTCVVAVKLTPTERTAIEEQARRARIGAGPLLRQMFFAECERNETRQTVAARGG